MHNFRNREQHNIDGTQSHKNEILVNTLGVDTKNRVHYRRSFQHTMQPLGLKRKNNVLMMEFVVSASPEFFLENQKKILTNGQSIK